MDLSGFFDASFNIFNKTGKIAFVIINEKLKDNIHQYKKVIPCCTSTEAEFMALYSLICTINDMQSEGLIPCQICICLSGDCKTVIDCINQRNKIRGISNEQISSLYQAFTVLSSNNQTVTLNWIHRQKNRLAHRTLKKKVPANNNISVRLNHVDF